jgi:predicted transcriptional regulator
MPGEGVLNLDTIRATVARLAKRRKSVRRIADEIGLSYTGLRWFLDGGKPQRESRRRLMAWYAGLAKDARTRLASEELAIATQLLANRVRSATTPALKRKRTRELIRAILAELDDDSQRAFLNELRALNS